MSKTGVPVVPAHPLHVALFVTELCISAMERGTGISVLELPCIRSDGVIRLLQIALLQPILSLSHVSRAPDVSLSIQSNLKNPLALSL